MATVLYTPEILGLATGLAAWPWDEAMALKGTARSTTCGSTLALGLETDCAGRISRVAIKPQACAIGQAAAAVFAGGAVGRDAAAIDAAAEAIFAWLTQRGPTPDWRGIEALAPARDYPARHGAILLPWQAARDLLPTN